MAKVELLYNSSGKAYRIGFTCPGCDCHHWITTSQYKEDGDQQWGFNGSFEKPTFTPSILSRSSWEGKPTVCHSFVTDGRIQFLGDCSHALAGQTIDLPEIINE